MNEVTTRQIAEAIKSSSLKNDEGMNILSIICERIDENTLQSTGCLHGNGNEVATALAHQMVADENFRTLIFAATERCMEICIEKHKEAQDGK